jgi:N-methylhydantoinase B/oxoprolinase/acetone carboxylase alpha subunit
MYPLDPDHQPLSGCRNLPDVLSDLKAQVAANSKGILLLRELMGEYGEPLVKSYMEHVQSNAETCVREMLYDFATRLGMGPEGGAVHSVDTMDDGTEIRLKLSIDKLSRTAIFDFSGSGPQVLGNWNAPTAITTAAVIYSLRTLVGREIPLNSGCMKPVEVIIPKVSTLRYCTITTVTSTLLHHTTTTLPPHYHHTTTTLPPHYHHTTTTLPPHYILRPFCTPGLHLASRP